MAMSMSPLGPSRRSIAALPCTTSIQSPMVPSEFFRKRWRKELLAAMPTPPVCWDSCDHQKLVEEDRVARVVLASVLCVS